MNFSQANIWSIVKPMIVG